MKRLILSILVCLSALSFFSACGKYEEGNNYSMLSKKLRLCGDWMLYEATDVNGNVIDSLGYAENLYLNRDGSFKKTATIYDEGRVISSTSISGSWRFIYEKESLALINASRDINLKYTIVRLSKDELKLRDEQTNQTFYFLPI